MKAARVLRRCNVSTSGAALLEYSLWLVVIAPAPSFAQTTARPPAPALDSSRLENARLFRAQREYSAWHLSKRQRLQIRKRREKFQRIGANYKCKFARAFARAKRFSVANTDANAVLLVFSCVGKIRTLPHWWTSNPPREYSIYIL
jgi:hypothetical protein